MHLLLISENEFCHEIKCKGMTSFMDFMKEGRKLAKPFGAGLGMATWLDSFNIFLLSIFLRASQVGKKEETQKRKWHHWWMWQPDQNSDSQSQPQQSERLKPWSRLELRWQGAIVGIIDVFEAGSMVLENKTKPDSPRRVGLPLQASILMRAIRVKPQSLRI